jgi:hypothetical protein
MPGKAGAFSPRVSNDLSIYATCWELRFPRHGDAHSGCDWVTVIGQGVPAHIGTPSPGYGYELGDPYASFLPPAVPVLSSDDGTALRALVVIRAGTEKVGQEYVRPLIVLSGREYATIPFPELHRRICNALRGNRPRLVAEWTDKDGRTRLIFDDGSTRDVKPNLECESD